MEGNNTLALCMIVKDEQHFLPRCLESVQGLVNEIIICDTGSIDPTKEIAQSFGAKIFDLPWPESFAEARNFSLKQTDAEWILVLDADEALERAQHALLLELLNTKKCYSLQRRHYGNNPAQANLTLLENEFYPWPENPHGYFTTHDLRLFPNHPGIYFTGTVHESIEMQAHSLNLYPFEVSPIIIHHFGALKSESQLRAKSETYIKLCKKKLAEGIHDWKSWFEIGVELQNRSRNQEAISCLREAAALWPHHHQIWLQWGIALLELQQPEQAAECLQKALSINSSCSLSWNAMGVVMMQIKNLDEAIRCFQLVLDANPKNLSARNNLAQALALKNQLPAN